MDIRNKTIDLIAHEKLLLRLPETHELFEKIQDRIYQLGAGLSGEQEVDRLLPEIGLPNSAKIIQSMTLEFIPQHFIQLDTVIITETCIFLLEIKRYSAGTVEFREDIGKTIRIATSQQVDQFDCVIDQIDRASYALKNFLSVNGFDIPIIPIIVIANTNTLVSIPPKNFPWKYPKQLPRFIRMTLQKMKNHEHFHTDKIHHFLQHSSYKQAFIPLCKRYNIHINQLHKGIFCTVCDKTIPFIRNKRICHVCGRSKATSFNNSLPHWFYLVDEKLTNRQARDFFNIPSVSLMQHYLRRSNILTKNGNFKGAYYTYKDL